MAVAKKATQHSNYWLNDDLFDIDNPVLGVDDDEDDDIVKKEGTDLSRLMRLAAIRRGIGNFVQILTNKNIPVNFSNGNDSYTDGDTVVISADTDHKKFDPMVGLALHEASHILLSDFAFLKAMNNIRNDHVSCRMPYRWYVEERSGDRDRFLPHNTQMWEADRKRGEFVTSVLMHPVLGQIARNFIANDTSGYKEEGHGYISRMLDDIKDIMNILEDRRIDKYVYENAQGYRPYYDALYTKYFFTKENGNNLRFNPEWREASIQNYINRMLLIFHPDASSDALPGLQPLFKMVDMDTIDRVGHNTKAYHTSFKYDDAPALWKEANLLYAYILQFAKLNNTRRKEQGLPTDQMLDKMGDQDFDGLPNLDGAPMSPEDMNPSDVDTNKGKPGKFNPSKAERDLKNARTVMSGGAKKKKIKKGEEQTIKSMDEAQAEVVDLKGDGVPFGNALVIRKVTDAVLAADWFPFGRAHYDNKAYANAIAAGRRMGAILEHRLALRNDPTVTKQTRLPQGGMDRRLLAQLGMDITSVFQKTRVDTYRPALLHLTLDASGSMGGKKWEKVLAVSVALAYIGSKMRNIDTVVSLRGGSDIPMVAIVFDSRRDNFKNYIRIAQRLHPVCGTPEGLCYKATMDLILESAKTHQVYLVNFSDGEPSFSYNKRSTMVYGGDNEYFSYYGEVAFTHTRKMVNTIREHGIKVMSYFIEDRGSWSYSPYGTSLAAFKRMYGESAENVNVENATEVLRTLNKLLLNRGA